MRHRIVSVVAVLFVLAFVAGVSPSFLAAKNRSRQKRTMADMRSIATAWEARATITNFYSVVDEASSATRGRGELPEERRVTTKQLAQALEPTYIRKFPVTDGWNTEFLFSTGSYNDLGRAEAYTIVSLGSDGKPDLVADTTAATTRFTDDIIYSNGSFVRYPEEAG